jgi:hypothetical protein
MYRLLFIRVMLMPLLQKMTKDDISQIAFNRLSKITGFFVLLIFPLAMVGMLMPSQMIAEGDSMATAANISLFQLAIVGETLVFLVEIVVVVLLYRLFESVNKTLSLIAAAARFAMTVIQGVNVVFYLLVLEVLTNSDYVSAFGAEQTALLSSLFLQGHQFGVYVWGIFFGLHLIFLGLVVYKSGFLPKILGVLLMAGSLGYLAESYCHFLLPENSVIFAIVLPLLIVSALGELVFGLWLLIKGVSLPANQAAEGDIL